MDHGQLDGFAEQEHNEGNHVRAREHLGRALLESVWNRFANERAVAAG